MVLFIPLEIKNSGFQFLKVGHNQFRVNFGWFYNIEVCKGRLNQHRYPLIFHYRMVCS